MDRKIVKGSPKLSRRRSEYLKILSKNPELTLSSEIFYKLRQTKNQDVMYYEDLVEALQKVFEGKFYNIYSD